MPMQDPTQCITSFSTPPNMQAPCIIPILLMKKNRDDFAQCYRSVNNSQASNQIFVSKFLSIILYYSCPLRKIRNDVIVAKFDEARSQHKVRQVFSSALEISSSSTNTLINVPYSQHQPKH